MKSIMNLFSRGVNSTVVLYENRLRSKFMKVKELSMKITKKVRKTLQGILHFVFGKPTSFEDYFHLGEWYISKQFLARFAVIGAAVALLLIYVVFPFLNGRLWPGSMTVNSGEFHEFSGKGMVYNTDGTLLYKGTVEAGVIDGSGEVYKQNQLIYKGEMTENQYEGQGTLYDGNGNVLYKGAFSDSLYEGPGTLYYDNGKAHFQGTFQQGQFKQGTEFYLNGSKKYKGEYENGLFSGNSTLYSARDTDRVLYAGHFENGQYNGQGKLYYKGSLVYEGAFAADLYNGDGKLYAGESLRYKGSFHDGKYDGEGTLFTEDGGQILYEGSFKMGLYDGEGTLYDKSSGRRVYAGGFAEGTYSGAGTMYGGRGQALFTGQFLCGEIDYLSYCDAARVEINEVFGRESVLEELDNSFVLIYDDLKVMFEFQYVDGQETPVVSRIKLYGNQVINSCANSITIGEFESTLKSDSIYTKYPFIAGGGEALMSGYTGVDVMEDDFIYCIKYVFDSYFIRAYSTKEDGQIYYYEIGGI